MILTFSLEYRTQWGEMLCVDVHGMDRFALATTDGVIWEGDVAMPYPCGTLHYNYCVCRDGCIMRRETGGEHVFAPTHDTHYYLDDAWDLALESNPLTHRRVAGTAVPVFALRSEGGFGVGDFGDLLALVHWAADTHQRAIQILPINDTTMSGTWKDSYPYNGISIYAFHPQYIDIRQLSPLSNKGKAAWYEAQRVRLNALPQVDYEAVNKVKRAYIHDVYEQVGREVLASAGFLDFFTQNADWLQPYAAFSYLRDIYHTADFNTWPSHAVYCADEVAALCDAQSEAYHELAFYYYVQYVLHRQLKAVADYAVQRGVILKGDIPIGISRHSVEAWVAPALFNLDMQAGAPPDAFSDDGQNWGFPTYNWHEMAKDGYDWWKRRFRKMETYFSAFRIDHILGFFRIWEIPLPMKSGLKGQFSPARPLSADEIAAYGVALDGELFLPDHRVEGGYHPCIGARKMSSYAKLSPQEKEAFNRLYEDYFFHRQDELWYREAMAKLPQLVHATSMLVCGEDLGMIPACVSAVMDVLKILSLEIQSMPKAFGQEFGKPWRYPRRSVCTISTHDMSPFRGWWQENPQLAERYYHQVLHHAGNAPMQATADLCREVVRMHLDSPSLLCILSLQDWLGIDEAVRNPDALSERINVPDNPDNNWNYRMHLTLEQLMASRELNHAIAHMVDLSDRC